jgi:hypothetical protein
MPQFFAPADSFRRPVTAEREPGRLVHRLRAVRGGGWCMAAAYKGAGVESNEAGF